MAELAAGDAGTETEVADGDGVVLEGVCKVVSPLGHGTDEDADALLGPQGLDVVVHPDDGGVEAKGDLPAVGREMVCDGVLDDLEQLLFGVGGADGEPVQQLDHEAGEPLEGARDADGGGDLDEHPLGRVDIYLQLPGLVDGRVEQGEQTLQSITTSL